MAADTEDSRMTLMTMIITTEGEDVIPTIHIHGDKKNVTNPSKLTLDFFFAYLQTLKQQEKQTVDTLLPRILSIKRAVTEFVTNKLFNIMV